MGLMSALNSAVSGLRTTQDQINLVSTNVANAGSVGYTRRVMAPVQQVADQRTVGVQSGQIQRVMDQIALKQLRLETAGAAYTSLMSTYATQLDKLFGSPGGAGSLDTIFNTFTQSLQTLLNDSGSSSAQKAVLDNADVLASQLGRISDSIQSLRTDAESRIGLAVDRANDLLSSIASANSRIVANQPLNDPGLLDERDRMINDLSQLMDVQVVQNQNGSVSISTTAGLQLFNGRDPIRLSFDGRGTLVPQSQYSKDGDVRSVGTITATSSNGVSFDLVGNKLISSGEIAAAIEMRDEVLVQAQRQLDELAAGMARALSDKSVVTESSGGFDVDVTDMQPGNTITLDYRTGTTAGRLILVATKDGVPADGLAGALGEPNATVVPFDLDDTPVDILAGINAAVTAAGLSASHVSGRTLRFSGAASALTGVAASATVTDLNSGTDPQLPFFVDGGYGNAGYSGSLDGVPHITGFAQRIKVNPDLLSDPSLLVKITPTTPSGDTERPQFLFDSLTKTPRGFSAAAGLSGSAPVTSTVQSYVQRVVETQGANAATAQRLNEGQNVALAAIESRYSEGASVNIDEEMAQLVTLQMAYGANARVMTAVRDMMDMLMRM
jgi:flagellar hook-associated protein 1 FlgK